MTRFIIEVNESCNKGDLIENVFMKLWFVCSWSSRRKRKKRLKETQKWAFVLVPRFCPALICIRRWVNSRVWMLRALFWTPESGQACFPFTQSANPSTSPANRAAVSPSLRRHMAAFFQTCWQDRCFARSHTRFVFSGLWTGHSWILPSYWLTLHLRTSFQTAHGKLNNSEFPAGPSCPYKHDIHALVLGFFFKDILYFFLFDCWCEKEHKGKHRPT